MEYNEFLEDRKMIIEPAGFDIEDSKISSMLFPFQRDIVKWALKLGRAALFEDCGLGKTPQQLEWARLVSEYTNKPVIIFAPLAVSAQTQREGDKFGIPVNVCEKQLDVVPGVNITNYQKMHHFNTDGWGGIVLDESSILKGFDGKTRKRISLFAESIPYKLCATATPAPNDLTELTRHAEFLGIMEEKEIKALFFTQDGNSTTKWRIKGHATDDFWRWMSQWSVAIRQPSDLGYEDNDFKLPELNIIDHLLPGIVMDGYLLPTQARTLTDERKARKETLTERIDEIVKLVNNTDEPFLVWCDYNYESEALAKAIPDAVEIKGSDKDDHKKNSMLGFSDGEIRVLVTKPSIAGFGMNWQHCSNQVFVGVSHSYERFYQAVRRSWRFGQTEDVNVHVIYSENEGSVVDNLRRKEKQASLMYDNIVKHMALQSDLNQIGRMEMTLEYDVENGKDWTMFLGDSVETIDNIDDESLGLIVFSPPFPGMYVYTNSVRDMGNSEEIASMVEHFRFLSSKMMTKLMPGRSCAIHLTQSTATISRDGFTGMRDFRGAVINMMLEEGWIYYGEVCIDKNPQVKAIRTKDHGLMFKSLSRDSAKMHMALADYVLQFKKPGDNPTPIRAGISEKYKSNGWVTNEEWIRWARPVWYGADFVPEDWYDIKETDDGIVLSKNTDKYWHPPVGISETDTLNVKQARETDDERHLCPLQLGVIHRAIKLWSAPGETVYSPFAGVGSEGYEAVKLERKFIGGELKRSYFNSACKNLRDAEDSKNVMTLFDFATIDSEK